MSGFRLKIFSISPTKFILAFGKLIILLLICSFNNLRTLNLFIIISVPYLTICFSILSNQTLSLEFSFNKLFLSFIAFSYNLTLFA